MLWILKGFVRNNFWNNIVENVEHILLEYKRWPQSYGNQPRIHFGGLNLCAMQAHLFATIFKLTKHSQCIPKSFSISFYLPVTISFSRVFTMPTEKYCSNINSDRYRRLHSRFFSSLSDAPFLSLSLPVTLPLSLSSSLRSFCLHCSPSLFASPRQRHVSRQTLAKTWKNVTQ